MNDFFFLLKLKTFLEYRNGKLIWKLTYCNANKVGQEAGSIESKGYRSVTFLGKRYKTHRLIWFLFNKKWPKGEIDHINGIKDDNRIENLRDSTPSQNQGNSKKPRGRKYNLNPGVSYNPKRRGYKKYFSQIRSSGDREFLGWFYNENDAFTAYKKRHKEIHGEFSPY